MGHALIVQDDSDSARKMAALVTTEGYSVATAQSLHDARRQLALRSPDLVLLDLHLPDGSGMKLLDDTALIGNSEVVLMTGQTSLETSIQALRHGVVDFLAKPVSAKQLQGILSRVMKPSVILAEMGGLLDQVQRSGRFGHLVGRSGPMRLVYEQIGRVAGTDVTVCIIGESGTGKELAARTLHGLSRRRGRPFVAVNCGAIPPDRVDSEIFGNEPGSFSGDGRRHQGLFERADGGTLFLDAITDMPPAVQVKLLGMLESGTCIPVGSTTPVETDVRIIAATSRDPARAVASGVLREDLRYQLDVFPIEMPPLRERLDDLPLLAAHFLREIGSHEGSAKHASAVALRRLAQYNWPGNVRELRNVLQRAYVMTTGNEIGDQWLPRNAMTDPVAPRRNGASLEIALGTSLAAVERQLILATLEHCGHHRERTAAALGVSLKTLYNRLKEYGL